MNQLTPTYTQPGDAQTVWLIAEREITTRLRSKAFIISTLIMLLLVFGAVLFSGFSSQSGLFDSTPKVAAVTGVSTELAADHIEVTEVADRAAGVALVESGEVDAALVPGGESPLGITLIGKESVSSSIIQLFSASPDVEILHPVTENPLLAMLIGLGFGIVWMMSAMTFGQQIAQSVVEEKQTRIVEILLANVKPDQLLAGKIIGNSILALGTVFLVIGAAAVGMLATGQDLLLGELGNALLWFGILFIFGFVLVAALYGALGSLVSRQEEVATVTSPLMFIIMIPYILVVMFFDNPGVLQIMSYVPFSAPVGMPMRLYLGTAEWWEPLVALALLIVTIAVVIWIGARIYAGSIMRTGARVKLTEALKPV